MVGTGRHALFDEEALSSNASNNTLEHSIHMVVWSSGWVALFEALSWVECCSSWNSVRPVEVGRMFWPHSGGPLEYASMVMPGTSPQMTELTPAKLTTKINHEKVPSNLYYGFSCSGSCTSY